MVKLFALTLWPLGFIAAWVCLGITGGIIAARALLWLVALLWREGALFGW
jgi:hypothetical protein